MKGRNTLIVEVKFYRESAKAYVGRGYSYETDMALNVGDRVLVPAGKGKNRAIAAFIREDYRQTTMRKIIDDRWAREDHEV